MKEEKSVTLEYDTPFPEQVKSIMRRALQITFEGCDIQWINDKTIKITKLGLKNITIKKEL